MPENLMSEDRHSALIKAAEETIGLMNIGVDGNAALTKVAQDQTMNDHEVEIVAHAVNNSKQLAHLQSASPEDREKAFPLIDPEAVKNDLQPATNASASVGTRYGPQDQPSQTAEDSVEQPDAVDIHKDLLEKAAADSYSTPQNYRARPAGEDPLSVLRSGWGLQQEKVALVQPRPNDQEPWNFQKLSRYQIGIDEARLRYLQKVSGCIEHFQTLREEMRRMDAPRWAEVEKVAYALGAELPTIDIAYSVADIEKFGHKRADLQTKTAGAINTTQRVRDLAEKIVRANTLWKEAADVYAAQLELQRRHDAEEAGLCNIKEAAGEYPYAPKELVSGGQVAIDAGEIAREFEEAPRDYFTSPETMISAAGGEPDAKHEYRSINEALDQPFRQDMANLDSRARLEGLMQDDFIGGHSLPEVVEAYNAAMSVNPSFGEAELVSYMRQHLATEGAVPLDLQIRARGKDGQKGQE